uniref:Putative capsid protein n=1 Tax=viral metagenome TaxID=1070528 RepID=A0A6M3KWB9_9ZZZZ
MDPEEFKKLTDMIQSAVNELHKATERQDAEITKFGGVTGETKSSVDKIQADLTGLLGQKADHDKKLEEMEVKLQRQTIPGAAPITSPADETKAAHKAAFYKFIRGGMSAMAPDERKALVEDATGQILVEPELDMDIIRELPKITAVRPLATVRTIGKDRLKMRSIGGVTVGWGKLETGTAPTESTPTVAAATYQYVEDLMGLVKIGVDELMDADFNLEGILAEEFARALGEEEDKQFILGDGHASQEPEGITINATLIGNTVTTTAAGAVTVEKFMEMLYQCPTQYRRNGTFMVNSTVELAMRQLRGLTGATYEGPFLWQPSVIAGTPNTFLGHPIVNQDDMLDLTAVSAVIAIFGDFKMGYRIVDRMGMTIQRITELYAEAGQVGFLITRRVTGGVLRASQQPLVLLTEL